MYIYSLFVPHLSLPLNAFFSDLLSSIPELLPVTIPGALVFVVLAFGVPALRQHAHLRLVRAAICAFSLASPFLISQAIKSLQGYRLGEHWLFFVAFGLLVGSLLGVMFPQKLLPVAGMG